MCDQEVENCGSDTTFHRMYSCLWLYSDGRVHKTAGAGVWESPGCGNE